MNNKIVLNSDLIKCQQRFTRLGENINIYVYSDNIETIHTTDGNNYNLENIYTVNLYDRIDKSEIKISFKCHVLNNNHTYSKIIKITKNGRNYSSPRYFYKYVSLINEIVYSMGLQYKGTIFN